MTMKIISSHTITDLIGEIRFIDYVIKNIPTVLSRNSAKKAIKNGELLLNGEVVEQSRFIKHGQVIEHIKKETTTKKVFEFELQVVFEDDHIAIINKPAGLSTSGNYFKTLQNALPYNLKTPVTTDALPIPRPVHRLDNQTSGLVVIAKTQSALINLGKQFENKTVKKSYTAIVIGKPENKGEINIAIEDKKAVTKYELITTVNSIKYKHISLLKLSPLTGRTHQLRIHMSEIEYPILGDKLYTEPELLFKGKGLFLCATYIRFLHPEKDKFIEFTIELPNKFKVLLKREQRRWDFAFNEN